MLWALNHLYRLEQGFKITDVAYSENQVQAIAYRAFLSLSEHPCTFPISTFLLRSFQSSLQIPHFFLLQLGSQAESVSVHLLKPATLPPNTLPALPPSRGRPAASFLLTLQYFSQPYPLNQPFPFLLLAIPMSLSNFHLFPPSTLSGRPTCLPIFPISSFPEEIQGGSYYRIRG